MCINANGTSQRSRGAVLQLRVYPLNLMQVMLPQGLAKMTKSKPTNLIHNRSLESSLESSVESQCGTHCCASIRVNGEIVSLAELLPAPLLSGVLKQLELGDRPGLAVAVNGRIIPKKLHAVHKLVAGDEVVIFSATQGG